MQEQYQGTNQNTIKTTSFKIPKLYSNTNVQGQVIHPLRNSEAQITSSFNKTTGIFNTRPIWLKGKSIDHQVLQDNLGKVNKFKHTDINKLKMVNNLNNENKNGNNNILNHRAIIPIDSKDNNDSFINELEDILTNVNNKEALQNQLNQGIQVNDIENENRSANDEEPDPNINFEHITEVNKSRPQTSYGGLNIRKKKLHIALKSAKLRGNEKNNDIIANGEEGKC